MNHLFAQVPKGISKQFPLIFYSKFDFRKIEITMRFHKVKENYFNF